METSQGALVPGTQALAGEWASSPAPLGTPWLVGPNAFSPASQWAEAEEPSSEETKAFLTDKQRVSRGSRGSQAWDGGVQELLSNWLGTKYTNASAPNSTSAFPSIRLAQTWVKTQAHPLPFGARTNNLG